MTNILTLTIKQSVRKWINIIPDELLKNKACLKLPEKCAEMERNTILDAILCARAYRDSIEIYNDKEDFWLQLYKQVKEGNFWYGDGNLN